MQKATLIAYKKLRLLHTKAALLVLKYHLVLMNVSIIFIL